MSGSWLQTFSGLAFDLDPPNPDLVRPIDIAHGLAHQCRFAGHTSRFYSVAQHSVLVSQIVERAIRALPQHRLTDEQKAEYALTALLHDAGEAYTCDVPNPVKVLQRGHDELIIAQIQDIVDRIDARLKHADIDAESTAWFDKQMQMIRDLSRDHVLDVEKTVLRVVHIAFDLDEPDTIELIGWRTLASLIKMADLRALATERRDLMREPPRKWVFIENVAPWHEPIVPMSPDEAQTAFLARLEELERQRRQKRFS